MTNPDIYRDVDDDAVRLAKTLLRTARFGALACIEPGSGIALASRVSVATDIDGAACFLISELSGHFAALEAEPRCSLMVGEPGKGDPLAHPRMTVIARAEKLTEADDIARVRRRFLARHPKAELYVDFTDFAFWHLATERASLNGGFGKAYLLEAGDIIIAPGTCPGLAECEAGAIDHMNEDHGEAVSLYATKLAGAGTRSWRLANIDPEGLDLVGGDEVVRVWFDETLQSGADLSECLVALAAKARDID